MRTSDQNSPLAKTYAEALLELAVAQPDPGAAEMIGLQLAAIRKIVREEPLVTPLLVDPAIGGLERHQLLDRVFKGRVDELLLKFLHVLADKERLNLLYSICGAYQIMLDERVGKVEVDMTVASRLDPAAVENVRQRIGAALKRDVVLHQYVDEKILGGLILRVGDKLIDGSVQAQLTAMREKFLAARPV